MGFVDEIREELGRTIILATSEEQAREMTDNAHDLGIETKGQMVWSGPVPPHSYMLVAPFVRMSTPEYYLFRKCNTLDEWDAIVLAAEMFSHFATWRTCHSEEAGFMERIDEPRTTPERMLAYLAPVADTEEAKRAMEVMRAAKGMVEDFERIIEQLLA